MRWSIFYGNCIGFVNCGVEHASEENDATRIIIDEMNEFVDGAEEVRGHRLQNCGLSCNIEFCFVLIFLYLIRIDPARFT